jgi:methyltransferase
MPYYFIFLAVFALRKVLDQRLSNRNIRKLEQTRSILPDRDSALPWLKLAHLLFFVLTPAEIILLDRRFNLGLGVSMAILFLLATLLRHWSTRLLSAQWNSKVVIPRDLEPVVTGPYRAVRHPNYLAMSLELVSAGLIYSAFISTAVVGVLNTYAVIKRIHSEEEVLFQVPAYRRSMEAKARLIPGIY